MAVADQVVVQLRADTQQYLAGVNKAESEFLAAMKAIDTGADNASASLTAMGNQGAAGLNKLASAAPRAAQSLRAVNANVANTGAQIQDIGVQLAAGTSPFTILAQQLPQITQNGATLGGVLAGLRQTVSALVSPVGLVVSGFTILASVAIPYFVELLSGSEKSEEQLKKEAQVIQEVATKWGDLLPAVKAYYDEIRKGEEEGQRLIASRLVEAAQYDQLREQFGIAFSEPAREATKEVVDLEVELQNVLQILQVLGESDKEVFAVQDAFKALRDRLGENKATAQDAEGVISALAGTLNSGVPDVEAFTQKIRELAAALLTIAPAAQAVREDLAAASLGPENLPVLGQLAPVFSRGGKIVNEQDVLNDRANRTKSQTQLAAEKAARGGRKGKTELEREQEATAELIRTLEHELSLIGLTNEERLVANNLRKLAASATDEQRSRVEELTRSIYAQSEAEKEAKKSAEELASIGKDALGGFIQDIRDGVSAADALKNALDRVLDRLLDIGFDALFSGASGGGGFLSKLFGGFRANGGSVTAGKIYGVNEKGIELFQPNMSGRVIPLTQQSAAKGSMGGATIHMTNVINAQGADPSVIPRFEAALAEVKRSIPNVSQATSKNASSRGVRPSQ